MCVYSTKKSSVTLKIQSLKNKVIALRIKRPDIQKVLSITANISILGLNNAWYILKNLSFVNNYYIIMTMSIIIHVKTEVLNTDTLFIKITCRMIIKHDLRIFFLSIVACRPMLIGDCPIGFVRRADSCYYISRSHRIQSAAHVSFGINTTIGEMFLREKHGTIYIKCNVTIVLKVYIDVFDIHLSKHGIRMSI